MENPAAEFRYERKFFVSGLDRHEVEHLVRLDPAFFREVYPPRFVNNVYLDSHDMRSYFDNVDGIRNRLKVRVRWYGEAFGAVEKPVLELKIKRGLVGCKESYRLPAMTFAPGADAGDFARVFVGADLPALRKLELSALRPALVNRYRRKYFLSGDRRIRLTIDTDLEFRRAGARNNSFLQRQRDSESVVVELKYAAEDHERAEQIAPRFPFRMTRSSKYVSGLDRLDLW